MKLIIFKASDRGGELFTHPVYQIAVGRVSPKAYILVTGKPSDRAWAVSSFINNNIKDIEVLYDDGWNGSYHDPVYYPAMHMWVVCATRKRGGWIGRLRRAARMMKEALAEESTDYVSEVNTTVTLIRRRIWREGD